MIVVDSSVWIAKLRNQQDQATIKFNSIRDTDEILIGDIILLEVLQGARDDRDAARIEYYLRSFHVTTMFGLELAVRAAANYRALRSRGVTIRRAADLVIGTFCIEHDHALLHRDRDFSAMEVHLGLQVF